MAKRQQIDAAGAILFRKNEDQIEIALIFRKGKWDLPKGKREKGEEIRGCAKRELEEELGISDVLIGEELIQTYHEYNQFDVDWGKTTYWFVATAPSQAFNPEAEEDIEKVEWCETQKAREIVDFENLIRVIDTFSKWILRQKYLY
ncbi:MAG: NUDIX domain-containing protein [Bacteroidetes bacterium]|nr:NUDIX domain-containing protein [Bacteroidota bacterium]NCQ12169.1 NUDIX domain-containing protein [Bacteroidota bacterium]